MKRKERDTLWHDPAKGSIMTYIQPDQTIPDRTTPHHTTPIQTGPELTRPDQTTRAREKQQDREKNTKIEGDKEIMTIFCN